MVSNVMFTPVRVLVLAKVQYNIGLTNKVESQGPFIHKGIRINNIIGLLIFNAIIVVNDMKAPIGRVVVNAITMVSLDTKRKIFHFLLSLIIRHMV